MKFLIRLRLIIISLVFILAFGCRKDDSPLSGNNIYIDENYPTIIHPISSENLQILQTEFDLLNDSKISTKLNVFGYTGKLDYSKPHANPGIKISKTKAVEMAVECVVKNSKFTNVSNSEYFSKSLSQVKNIDGDSTRWGLRFGSQFYLAYEIPYTYIYAFVCGDGVYQLIGYWYSDIYIPSKINFDIEHAKEKIIGKTIIWYDIDSKPHEFVVSYTSISDSITKSIFPVENMDSIELRVTWKIPIIFGSFIGWHIYLDIMTGEIVANTQEFRT